MYNLDNRVLADGPITSCKRKLQAEGKSHDSTDTSEKRAGEYFLIKRLTSDTCFTEDNRIMSWLIFTPNTT